MSGGFTRSYGNGIVEAGRGRDRYSQRDEWESDNDGQVAGISEACRREVVMVRKGLGWEVSWGTGSGDRFAAGGRVWCAGLGLGCPGLVAASILVSVLGMGGCPKPKPSGSTVSPPPATQPPGADEGQSVGNVDGQAGQGQQSGQDQNTGGTDSNEKPYTCPSSKATMMPRIVWRPDALGQRRYSTETDLTKVHSSKAEPVEVCGVREQLRWLLMSVCPDGSHPFSDNRVAHSSRVGNVGPGGRCGVTIVDLYRVPCKDKVYMVYMDLYNCVGKRPLFGR